MSVRSRQFFKEIMENTPITMDMLTEAHSRAFYWHQDNGSKRIKASTVAQMLESVVHEQKQQQDIAANVMGAAHQADLQNGTRSLHTLGGGLTRNEAAQVRSMAGAVHMAREIAREDQELAELTRRRREDKKSND